MIILSIGVVAAAATGSGWTCTALWCENPAASGCGCRTGDAEWRWAGGGLARLLQRRRP